MEWAIQGPNNKRPVQYTKTVPAEINQVLSVYLSHQQPAYYRVIASSGQRISVEGF
jgi:hypothetical protein